MPDRDPDFIFTTDDGKRFGIFGPPDATIDHAQDKLKELQRRFPGFTGGKVEKAPLTGALAPTPDPGMAAGVQAGLMPMAIGALQRPGDETSMAKAARMQQEQDELTARGRGHPLFDIGEGGSRAVRQIGPHLLGGAAGTAIKGAELASPLVGQMIGHGASGLVSGALKPVQKGDIGEEKRRTSFIEGLIDTMTAGAAGVVEKGLEAVGPATKTAIKKGAEALVPTAKHLVPLGEKAAPAVKAAAEGGVESAATSATEASEAAPEDTLSALTEKIKGMAVHRGVKGVLSSGIEAIAEPKQLRGQLEQLPTPVLEVLSKLPAEDQRILIGGFVNQFAGVERQVPKAPVPAAAATPLKRQPSRAPLTGVMRGLPPPVMTALDDPLSHSTPALAPALLPQEGDPYEAAGQYLGELSGFSGP